MKKQDLSWYDNFRGRCVACTHAQPTNRSKEMLCTLDKAARNCGLTGSKGGGTWFGTPVSKMFGCIYFESIGEADHKHDEQGCS